MPIVVPQGNFSLSLKSNFKLGQAATDAWFLNPASDPTSVALNAPAGSLAFFGGGVFIKNDTGTTTNWTAVATSGASSMPFEMYNLGLACSVAGNALTIALKQADGSTNPAAGSGAVKIGFRSATLTSGAYLERSVTGALSVVVSSGSTLGTTSSKDYYLWVYALDNAGTVELAVSQTLFDEKTVLSSMAEGGAGAADTNNVIYSTTARSNVAMRVIGRLKVNQATAGTWAAVPTEVSVSPPMDGQKCVVAAEGSATSLSTTLSTVVWTTALEDTMKCFDISTGIFTFPFDKGYVIWNERHYINATFAAGDNANIRVSKNGTATIVDTDLAFADAVAGVVIPQLSNVITGLVKNDTLRARVGSAGTSPTFSSASPERNKLSIIAVAI